MGKTIHHPTFEDLEQFDFGGDFESYKDLPKKYFKEIGIFMISFSFLENALNIIVSEILSDRAHDTGYRVISTLSMRNKIEFFYSIFLNFISVTDQEKLKKKLKVIQKELTTISEFRNALAHANWSTLKRDGYVRTKITTNRDDGRIVFKNIKVTPQIISTATKQISSLIVCLEEFSDLVHEQF